jgi:hypothetical protein
MLAIGEPLNKAANVWCKNCDVGKGCKIYDDRPEVCVTFKCIWLESQTKVKPPMPAWMRPDKSKVMLAPSTTDEVLAVHVDPLHRDAWRKDAFTEIFVNFLSTIGQAVCISYDSGPNKHLITMKHGVLSIRPVVMSPPDENGIQWATGNEDAKRLGIAQQSSRK